MGQNRAEDDKEDIAGIKAAMKDGQYKKSPAAKLYPRLLADKERHLKRVSGSKKATKKISTKR